MANAVEQDFFCLGVQDSFFEDKIKKYETFVTVYFINVNNC